MRKLLSRLQDLASVREAVEKHAGHLVTSDTMAPPLKLRFVVMTTPVRL